MIAAFKEEREPSVSNSIQLPGRLCRSFLSGLLIVVLLPTLFIAPASPARAVGVIYVVPGGAGSHSGADWANATDLQDALTNAVSGDQLWVKAGTYKPTSGTDRSSTFQLKSGVAVYGGFAGMETALSQRSISTNVTILSGDLLSNDSGAVIHYNPTRGDNSYHVVTGSSTDSTAIIDGFVISAGNANISDAHDAGGGMLNVNASPTIRSVKFTDNSASYGGGGMENYNGSNPTVNHVVFINNTALYGGGMENRLNSTPTVTYVFFSNNTGYSGGGMSNFRSSPTISHAIFSGNTAAYGAGGIENGISNPIISHVTFSNNSAPVGGGICNVSSTPIIQNSVLWGNNGDQICNNYAGTPIVRYSLVQGGYISGTNILDTDPRFIDADGADNITGTLDDDLRPQFGSPAIDAGNDTFIPADATDEDGDGDRAEAVPFDLDGKPRVVNGTVDLGAYEWQLIANSAPPSPVSYGSPYSYTFDLNITPATFKIKAGALPPGLTLASSGRLSGTLTAAGIYTATIEISTSLGLDAHTFTIVVNKAPLTVKANNVSRVVGAPNPPFSATYSGFVNGDTPASLGGVMSFATPATAASPSGAYAITPRGLSSANYAIVYMDGVLTIRPRLIYLPLLRRA
jgi:MBG domain (YGX type)